MKNNFKIFIKDNADQEILLSEYSPGKSSISFDETLTEEENSRYILNFKIVKNYLKEIQTNFKIEDYIRIGRPVVLKNEDLPSEGLEFIISSIAPEGSRDNIVWNVTCQDYASYVFSKNNIGLNFDTIEDEEYLIWLRENELEGLAKDIINYILQKGYLQQSDFLTNPSANEGENWKSAYDTLTSAGTNPLEGPLYSKINLSVSSSNTYNALVELAFLLDSFLLIDYERKIFDLVSRDDDNFRKNYLLTPEFNLQSLSLNYNGDSLAPILYVIGGNDEFGIAVSMIPFFNYSQYKRMLNYSTKVELIDDLEIENSQVEVTVDETGRIFIDNELLFPNNSTLWDTSPITLKFGEQKANISLSILFNGSPRIIENISNNELRFTKQGSTDLWEVKLFSNGTQRESIVAEELTLTLIPRPINPIEYSENFYSDIVWDNFQPSEDELEIINRIPYLDSFIINLDYFKRNNLIEDEAYNEILFKIYNELRIINLVYQRLTYNKFTSEGEIRRIDSAIQNYAELLARSEENDYTTLENTLDRLLVQEGGRQIISTPVNIDAFLLEEIKIRDETELKETRLVRDLISNDQNSAYFYSISEEVFDALIENGYTDVTEDLQNDDDSKLSPNEVFTNYENGSAKYFVTIPYNVDYKVKIGFKTPIREIEADLEFNSLQDVQEIDEIQIIEADFQNSSEQYYKYELRTGIDSNLKDVKDTEKMFSNTSDFVTTLPGFPFINADQNSIQFLSTTLLTHSGTATNFFQGILGHIVGNFLNNAFYRCIGVIEQFPIQYVWLREGSFNQSFINGFALNSVYRITSSTNKEFWYWNNTNSKIGLLIFTQKKNIFIKRFQYSREFLDLGFETEENLYQDHPNLRVPTSGTFMEFDQSNKTALRKTGNVQQDFQIGSKTFSEGKIYGNYAYYDQISVTFGQSYQRIQRFRNGFVRTSLSLGIIYLHDEFGDRRTQITSTTGPLPIAIHHWDTDNENYVAIAYASGNNSNLDVYYIDSNWDSTKVFTRFVFRYTNSPVNLIKPLAFNEQHLYFLGTFGEVRRWEKSTGITELTELVDQLPRSAIYLEAGMIDSRSTLFAFYLAQDWQGSLSAVNARNDLVIIQIDAPGGGEKNISNVALNIKTAKWIPEKQYLAFSGYGDDRVGIVDLRDLNRNNWNIPDWKTDRYSPNGSTTGAQIRHIDYFGGSLFINGTSGLTGESSNSLNRIGIKRYNISASNHIFWSKSHNWSSPFYAPVFSSQESFFVKNQDEIFFAPSFLVQNNYNSSNATNYASKFIFENVFRDVPADYLKNTLLIENRTQHPTNRVNFFETDWFLSQFATFVNYENFTPILKEAKIKYLSIAADTLFEILPYFELMRVYSGFDYIQDKEYQHLDLALEFIKEKNSILEDLQELEGTQESEGEILSLGTQLDTLRAAVGDASGLVIDNLPNPILYQSNFRNTNEIKWQSVGSTSKIVNNRLINSSTGSLTPSVSISIKEQITGENKTFLARAKIRALDSGTSSVILKSETSQPQTSQPQTLTVTRSSLLNDWFELELLITDLSDSLVDASLIVEHEYSSNSTGKRIEVEYIELIDLTEMKNKEYIPNPTISEFKSWEQEGNYFKGEGENLYQTYPGKFTLIYSKYKNAYKKYLDKQPFNISFDRTILGRYIKKGIEKNQFWFELKQKYGKYLYEGFYENTLESDPVSLYKQGLENSKYYDRPDEDYSISYIDGSDIVNLNIEPIKVGDYIKISGEKLGIMKDERNEIQVLSITKNLRDKSNISLTVNQTRKNDSLVEKILSGLNR